MDDVLVFRSNVTDYAYTPEVKSSYFGLDGAGAGKSGVTTLRIDFVETGTFKLIIRAYQTENLIIAESLPFTVTKSSATLTLDKEQYVQGQQIRATFSDPSQLDLIDDVLVFRSDVTEYTYTPEVKSSYFGLDGAGTGNSGVTILRVDFVETGTFKLIIRASQTENLILAESLPFTVAESSATLTLDNDQYIQGQQIRATFSDPSQLDLMDDVLVFRSNVTDYTYTPEVKSSYFGTTAGAGNSGITMIDIDFDETGTFKVIIRTSNSEVVLAESPSFIVSLS
jgi:DNA/RNA endonuclease YhcR with UshA esterase domain